MQTPAHLTSLKEALDKSSTLNRNLGLVFVSFLVYVLVIVVSTTDYQLLIPDEGINLPILDFELPLFGFYIVAPGIVLILHLNLLFSLLKHSEKLYEWQRTMQQALLDERTRKLNLKIRITNLKEKVPSIDLSKTLSPFLFNYLPGLKKGSFSHSLVLTLVYVSAFLFPLGLLVYIQLRFSDYQSGWMTGYHWLLVVIDVITLWRYIPRIFLTDDNRSWWRKILSSRGYQVTALAVSAIDLMLVMLMISGLGYSVLRYGPHLEVTGQLLLQKVPSEELVIQREEAGIPIDSIYIKYGQPLDLSRRNLIFADFRHSQLYNVNLRLADLQGAILEYANLLGAELYGANLQGANLFRADLEGAEAWITNFQGAILFFVDLKGADLTKSNFQGAELGNAYLQRAKLHSALLQGAYLGSADLQGANLSSTNLQRADLSFAKLQGAYLAGVDLQGGDLVFAYLQGADLSEANLQGADLSDANLQGADLSDADLQGADLASANLQGADLWRADLQGAELTQANLQGAWIHNSVMLLDSLCGCHYDSAFISDPVQLPANWDPLVTSTLAGWSEGQNDSLFLALIREGKERDSVNRARGALTQSQLDTAGFLAYREKMMARWEYDIEDLYIGFWSDTDSSTTRLINTLNDSLQARLERQEEE